MKFYMAGALIYALLVFTTIGAPPTVDLTYRPATTGRPFEDPSPLPTEGNYLKHMPIRPVTLQVLTGTLPFADGATLAHSTGEPVTIRPGQGNVLSVDFGQELAGRVEVWGTAGASFTITTGESAEECVHTEPHLDNSGPFKLTLAGTEAAATPYSAFRYARLTFTGNAPVTLTRIVCDHKYYPVTYWGSFNCSDPLLTRIWYVGAYTAHLCMQEAIWDAPKRDRGLWIGDLQVTGQTINNVFADKFLMERSIAKVRDQAQGGRPPTELPVEDVNKLPGYSAAWFCTLADFYRHAGDQAFLAQQQQKIVSLLKYQQTLFDTNDVFVNPHKEWPFCDWSPGFVLDNPLTRATSDLYVIHGVREAVWLLRQLGDATNAATFSAWADQLTTAARARFLTPATQTYGDRIQQNVMAVLSGTATPEQADQIYARVLRAGSPAWTVQPDLTRHDNDAMTPYYGNFVLQAMAKLGHYQAGLDLIRRYWGDILRRGATTWWEKFNPSWPDDFKWALDQTAYLSLCHGWSSGPTSYLTETVLGVQPTGAGFITAEIRPELGDLTWAEGDVPTPHGLIHVRVECEPGRQIAIVTLPPHVAARIQLAGKTLLADHAGTFHLTAPVKPSIAP